jgi:hypothetical protein
MNGKLGTVQTLRTSSAQRQVTPPRGPSHLGNRNTNRLLDPAASDAQMRPPPVSSPYRLPLATNALIQTLH